MNKLDFSYISLLKESALMADAGNSSTTAQVVKIFFDSTISFYDKAPIIVSIGYLLIASSLPLFLILRFAAKMKRLDNEKIIALYEKEISGVKKGRNTEQNASVSAASPPQV
ncbi:hypothetical protein [Escherichia coli]|uniref:hypothetical protein n=1 Tax=Escherichia coli TaxID=562 RepID=UPI003D64B1C4